MTFLQNTNAPAAYRAGALVALHGSWNRATKAGYKVGKDRDTLIATKLAQTLGMTPDDVYQAYVKKNEVNFKRQESGYTQKDHADSRHI